MKTLSTQTWNEAHGRLLLFLDAFALADRRRAARLALEIVDEAERRQTGDPSRDPLELTQEIARERIAGWLAESLEKKDRPEPEILEAGYLALLLSGVPENRPEAFLVPSPSTEVREAMRRTLLVTGPDLTVSSMTPRRLDYGPMRNFAQQTWQRWDPREILAAFVLWTAIFFILYRWLPDWL